MAADDHHPETDAEVRREPRASAGPGASEHADRDAKDAEFAIFYQNELPRLVAFLLFLGAEEMAADVAQDAMLEAYRQWDLLDRPSAWVRLVARRRWWKLAYRSHTEVPHAALPEPTGLLAPAEYELIETRHILLRVLANLTDVQREMLAWSYDGYQPTEIAVALGKSPATVRSILRAARGVVQRALQANEHRSADHFESSD